MEWIMRCNYMRVFKYVMVIVLAAVSAGVAVRLTSANAATADTDLGGGVVVAPLTLAGTEDGGGGYAYVGTSKCKMCHMKPHYKDWKKSKKAKSMNALEPGEASEIKSKFGLDVSKDYTRDETCLECHATGFGKPGGYAIPDPDDAKAVKKAKKLAHVGCESCHGPGSAYVKLHKEVMTSKRKYKVEEFYAVGMTKIEASICTGCHNKDNPTFDEANPFDFAKMKEIGAHTHKVLTQRED